MAGFVGCSSFEPMQVRTSCRCGRRSRPRPDPTTRAVARGKPADQRRSSPLGVASERRTGGMIRGGPRVVVLAYPGADRLDLAGPCAVFVAFEQAPGRSEEGTTTRNRIKVLSTGGGSRAETSAESHWSPGAIISRSDGARASATRAVKGGVTSSASMAGMRSGKIPLTASTPGRRQRHRCLIRDNPRPSWPGPAHDRDAGAVAAPRLVRCGAARRITCRCSMDRTCSQTPASLTWRASPEGGVPSLGGPSSAYTWPSGLTGRPPKDIAGPAGAGRPAPGRWTGGDRSPRSAAGSASAASVPAASWTHHIGSPGNGSRE